MTPSPDLLLAAVAAAERKADEAERDMETADEALEAVARAFADYDLWRDPSFLDDARRALRSAGYDA